ncbi:hypothetical protein GUJ93_ZPchr0004g38344 [Zizania palustris]|uniref:Uncharacterized protein n=1 Tax=Zizania palustris TaxID=103762 RepID=A0A8J5VZM4_ZIZPA|nr:hypothetical protein GUJ93_ZPchr0004g38344 [Zizania palustris]
MRRSSSLLFLASLLLLLLVLILAERAHGIRLDRQLHEAISSKEMGESKARQPFNTATLTNEHCTSDGRHCSGKAKTKTLVAQAETQQQQQQQQVSASPDAANRGGAKEQETTSSSSTTYPYILDDIAGMDYSPATRKPPIHN